MNGIKKAGGDISTGHWDRKGKNAEDFRGEGEVGN